MGNKLSKQKVEINKIRTIERFENIKSKYILQKIFNNLEKKKFLKVIKYNKNIRYRLDININDYKEYCEQYLSIEIEIKLGNHRHLNFINIKFDNDEGSFIYKDDIYSLNNNNDDYKYYHIYFDNNKNEIKRNYIKYSEHIKKIKIIIDYQIKSFKNLFYECDSIESICFKKFYRNNINNMSGMFRNCSSLKKIKFNNFNIANVTNMSKMFKGCSSLKELILIQIK